MTVAGRTMRIHRRGIAPPSVRRIGLESAVDPGKRSIMSDSSYPEDLKNRWARPIERRELLRQGAALAGAAALGARKAAAQEGNTLRFFPGFKPFRVDTTG